MCDQRHERRRSSDPSGFALLTASLTGPSAGTLPGEDTPEDSAPRLEATPPALRVPETWRQQRPPALAGESAAGREEAENFLGAQAREATQVPGTVLLPGPGPQGEPSAFSGRAYTQPVGRGAPWGGVGIGELCGPPG